MRRWLQTSWIELLVPALVLPLFFWGLGQTVLWQDEAQTALLARHVLRHGLPMVGQGPDSASALVGRDATSTGLFVHVPPLQSYLCALSLALFGETSLAARLPFAVAGWMCVCLLPWFLRPLTGRAPAVAAQLILGTHVPFLLYSRQARYYALAALLMLTALGGILRLATWDRGRAAGLVAVVAGVLLAICFDFSFAAWWLVSCAVLLWGSCRGRKQCLRWGLPVLTVPFVVWLGWLWVASAAPSRQFGQGFNEDAPDVPWYFLGQLNAYGVPLVLGLLLLPFAWRTAARGERIGMAACWGAVLLQAVLATYTTHRFYRYVVPTLPLAVAAAVLTWESLSRRCGRRWIWLAGWAVLASGFWAPRGPDGAAWWPWDRWLESVTDVRWSRRMEVHLGALLLELSEPPHGPVAAVVNFLRGHARPGDVVVAEYSEKPLKFHTRCRVYGGETGQFPDEPPRFVWRRAFPSLWWEVKVARRWLDENVDLSRYRKVTLDVPDRLWENRPDPERHVFRSDASAPYPPVEIWVLRRHAP